MKDRLHWYTLEIIYKTRPGQKVDSAVVTNRILNGLRQLDGLHSSFLACDLAQHGDETLTLTRHEKRLGFIPRKKVVKKVS